MIYFTADTHFGHENIIRFCDRPFSSVQEMDETLIHNFNSVVKENDTTYIIGDFSFHHTKEYAKRLNGHKYLLVGSHDKQINNEETLGVNITLLPSLFEIKPNGLADEYGKQRLIVLCHYSMRSWNKSHYASYHLFGHHHGRLEPYGLSFDVGVDTNNFFPYSLDDVEKKMKTLKPIVDFRSK